MNSVQLRQEVPETHKRVLALLQKGKRNARTAKEIVSIIGGSDKKVRVIIHELVTKYKILIAGSNHMGSQGYYIIETEQEREEAIANLSGRIIEMYKRVQVLKYTDELYDPTVNN